MKWIPIALTSDCGGSGQAVRLIVSPTPISTSGLLPTSNPFRGRAVSYPGSLEWHPMASP